MRCAECGTRSQAREYATASRLWGGNYRQAARHGTSTICDRCVTRCVRYILAHDEGQRFHPWGSGRWNKSSVEGAAALLARRGARDRAHDRMDR